MTQLPGLGNTDAARFDNDVDAKAAANEVCLAIDIGGTKMVAGVVDAQGRVIAHHRVATPHGAGADEDTLFRALMSAVEALPEPTRPYAGIGVGCSGPMRWPAGKVSPLNVPGWRDFPLRERLGERFPGIPVRLHNDAVCTAVAEHWLGAGRGSRDMLGMVVSTGVGGGLILGGHIIDGKSGNAGHIGHMVVDPTGPRCVCGGVGCLEAVACGPRLAAWATEQGWRPGAPERSRTGRDLAADAERGEKVARDAMRRAGRAIGIAIASATVTCDLEVVAIGGGLSQAGALIFDPLQEALATYIGMEFARHVRVVPAELGQLAGLIGAAALVHRAESYWSAD